MMALVVGGAVAQKFLGSVVDKHSPKTTGPHPPGVLMDNATMGVFNGKHDDGSRLDSYIIILAIVSTIFPLICLILSLVIARSLHVCRRLWVKYRGERCPATVEREDTAQTSIKSRDGGSRKSSRASRVTKDPNSRDQLIPQDSMITSPSEGPVEEEGEDHMEEIVVRDVEDESNEVASKVSVSMKNHSLVVEVEGAPNVPESPMITENGKTHHLTEAQVEPRVSTIAGDMLKTLQLPGAAGEIGMYLKRSKSERVRPRTSGEEGGHGVVGETVEHISPRPHHRRLSMGHHPRASHHGTPQRLTVEPENGNFGLSTSDVSLDSSSSCNPSYKYGNQVSYAGGYYGYPVSQGYPAADRHSRRMHLVVPRGSGGEDTLGMQREKVDRKTSLPNSLDNQQQQQAAEPKPSSLSPSRSVSRGALSKQYSLPASARNTATCHATATPSATTALSISTTSTPLTIHTSAPTPPRCTPLTTTAPTSPASCTPRATRVPTGRENCTPHG
ncbi:uncharacterized protein LOC123508316 isoform X3 [Portunus trituberculatus]|uniref:uncharacterized protein LOC123508316 isoform X3 n=1 Tax=Portunus trituberculatus TaxID=210409 RepID=UPI001E1CF8CB|nr:uncharacterized protein LOC123508316 isoform X3 [Portunus trituberculatus]